MLEVTSLCCTHRTGDGGTQFLFFFIFVCIFGFRLLLIFFFFFFRLGIGTVHVGIFRHGVLGGILLLCFKWVAVRMETNLAVLGHSMVSCFMGKERAMPETRIKSFYCFCAT